MLRERLQMVVRHVHQWAARQTAAAELSDGHLLHCFVVARDEAAFRILLDRYGRMVLGVCRRILGDHAEAEDAFQATFLILVRKAGSLDNRGSLASWLYTVAQRVAMRARATARRRQQREQLVIRGMDGESRCETTGTELRDVLDTELARLPHKYREPLIQCYLLGHTYEEAARQLGWTTGTVSGRLARAREMLRQRLLLRGIVPSATGFAALWTVEPSYALPIARHLGEETARNALAVAAGTSLSSGAVPAAVRILVEENMPIMLLTKKTLAAVGVLCVLLGSAVTALMSATTEKPQADLEHGNQPMASGADAQQSAVNGADAQRLVLAVADAREQQPPGVNLVQLNAAHAAGLKWLVRHQAPDGRWSYHEFDQHGQCNCSDRGQRKDDCSAPGLVLVALLSAGEIHNGNSIYSKNVEKGLKALIVRQGADGRFEGGGTSQGLATLALCRAYAKTGDPTLKGPAQRAVDNIVSSQDASGGWRERPGDAPRLRATFWQALAVQEGQQAGLNIPAATRKGIAAFLDALVTPDGLEFRDTPQDQPTPIATAMGLLFRPTAGGIQGLRKRLPTSLARDKDRDMFYYFVATQVMDRQRGKDWKVWGPAMASRLLDRQDRGLAENYPDQKGSWSAEGDKDGRLLVTALSVLILQADYARLQSVPQARKEPSQRELLDRWHDLASSDFAKARDTVSTFIDNPKQAVPFLGERLQPIQATPQQIERWIKDLNAESFEVREKATLELEILGDAAETALRELIANNAPLEVQERVQPLLRKLAVAGEDKQWRAYRSIEVLETIGNREAVKRLEKTSTAADAALAREAKAALKRLSR